jgi:N-acetylglucosamine-6-phosphate deacetylase
VPLGEAVRALTATPAGAIGFGGSLGLLLPGRVADAVLLDSVLAVHGVWTGAAPTR